MWFQKHKWQILLPLLAVVLLVTAFYFGGSSPSSRGWGNTETTETTAAGELSSVPEESEETADATASASEYSENHPKPIEPQDVEIGTAAHTCRISITCASILDHMDFCDPDKVELVPEDGWILKPMDVTFYEGESVFNVLQRVCKQQKIHMEYEDTPMYNSAYIEGIHNLYEFDVGELSGWMYRVNDWFPNFGCSRYQLQDGDVIEWIYTCDLGADIGGGFVAQTGTAPQK